MGEGDFVVEAFDGDLDASLIGEFLRLPHAFITSKLVLRWCSKPATACAELITFTGSSLMFAGLVDFICLLTEESLLFLCSAEAR